MFCESSWKGYLREEAICTKDGKHICILFSLSNFLNKSTLKSPTIIFFSFPNGGNSFINILRFVLLLLYFVGLYMFPRIILVTKLSLCYIKKQAFPYIRSGVNVS